MNNRRIEAALPVLKETSESLLGRYFNEYVSESDHQGWDGWNSRDLSAVGRFLEDFVLYMKMGVQMEVEDSLRAIKEKESG